MWTWTRSSSFKSFFCFRNWLKNISNFIFLADRLSGRTWYGLLDVWYHTFLARATLSPSPLPYFSWLSLWPITFSRASTFSTAQQNNGPYFLFFIFLHSYLLYFYCVKRYTIRVRWPASLISSYFVPWISRVYQLAALLTCSLYNKLLTNWVSAFYRLINFENIFVAFSVISFLLPCWFLMLIGVSNNSFMLL